MLRVLKREYTHMKTDKATVIAREVIHDGVELGTVIEIDVPKKAKRLSFPGQDGDNGGSYLHFIYPVKGGIVNVHVRTEEDLQGRKISAHVHIVHKTMSDGKHYLYVDLFPAAKHVTHWLRICGSENEPQVGWLIFEVDDFVPTICLTTAGDKRLPAARDINRYADTTTRAIENDSPFAILASLR